MWHGGSPRINPETETEIHTHTLWPSNLETAVNLNRKRHNDFLPQEVYSLALCDTVDKVTG